MIEEKKKQRRKQLSTYLIHRTYGKVQVLAARFGSSHHWTFLVELQSGERKTLIANPDYWENVDEWDIEEIFNRFMEDSDIIEKALAAAQRKEHQAAEVAAGNELNLDSNTAVVPESDDSVAP
jgi:hypothetical protein